ncbi:UNVERIFIED_CONTAM: hypothetical protein K2H54_004533 [Gekko kuhli]
MTYPRETSEFARPCLEVDNPTLTIRRDLRRVFKAKGEFLEQSVWSREQLSVTQDGSFSFGEKPSAKANLRKTAHPLAV